jgi:eukaryotic-like serine/threonine-protein kinase
MWNKHYLYEEIVMIGDRTGRQFGSYNLTRLLGKGGFAEVYLGKHILLDSEAAIKILSTTLSDKNRENFLTEAKRLVQLRHPNIVRLLDFGIEEDTPFLVMDYAPLGTLREIHPVGSPVSLETILPYIRGVADALQYAHNQQLIHRDVKPQNMLLGLDGKILLSDFGIAVVSHHSVSQSIQTIAGTPLYMAPEQEQGKAVPASDQYALGVVIYEWLCGESPFQGSQFEVAYKHQNEMPPSLCEKIPMISPAIELVILTALEKEPKKRFENVQTFASALEFASRLPKSLHISISETQSDRSTIPIISTIRLSSSPDVPTQRFPFSKTAARQQQLSSKPTVETASSYQVPESSQVPTSLITRKFSAKRLLSRRSIIMGGLGLVLGGIGIEWATSPHPIYTFHGHTQFVTSIAWSPDGKRIASAEGAGISNYGTVQVWDATSGGNHRNYFGHNGPVTYVAWSPNGNYLASVGDDPDDTVKIWDAYTTKTLTTYSAQSGVNPVAWSPNGDFIAFTGSEGNNNTEMQIWNVSQNKMFSKYLSYLYIEQISFAWSPDSKYIAYYIFDSPQEGVNVINLSNGKVVFSYPHPDQINMIAWSPDGHSIAFATNANVQIWDTSPSPNHLVTYPGHLGKVNAVAWSPDSKKMASAGEDRTVQVWDAFTGNNSWTYEGHATYYLDHYITGAVTTVAWSPKGGLIASGSHDKTVQVWQAP